MTSPNRYSYCALYLRGVSENAAADLAARATGAQRDGRLLHIDGIDIEVLRNPDRGHDATDSEFPTWPVKVELKIGDGASRQLVDAVSKILTSTWGAGYDAIAACDYEDELPDQGGYPRHRS